MIHIRKPDLFWITAERQRLADAQVLPPLPDIRCVSGRVLFPPDVRRISNRPLRAAPNRAQECVRMDRNDLLREPVMLLVNICAFVKVTLNRWI